MFAQAAGGSDVSDCSVMERKLEALLTFAISTYRRWTAEKKLSIRGPGRALHTYSFGTAIVDVGSKMTEESVTLAASDRSSRNFEPLNWASYFDNKNAELTHRGRWIS